MPYWRLFYHLVWATRGREAMIRPEIEGEVHRLLRQAAQRQHILVHAIGGVADHVHLAASIPPSLSIATAIGQMKGGSAHAINRAHGSTFGWQPEYGILSFAERHLEPVVAYINNQPRRHAARKLWPLFEHMEERAEPRRSDIEAQPGSPGFVL